jgi:hypothetical protein
MKIVSITSLAVGALPLLIYPFVLLADIMSLSSGTSSHVSVSHAAAALSFLLGSSAYPVVCLLWLVFSCIMLKKNREKMAFGLSIAPLAYVAVLIGLFLAWNRVPNGAA